MTNNISEKLIDRINDWQVRLLQLDKRNPLLNSPVSKKSIVVISGHDPDSFFSLMEKNSDKDSSKLEFDHSEPISFDKDIDKIFLDDLGRQYILKNQNEKIFVETENKNEEEKVYSIDFGDIRERNKNILTYETEHKLGNILRKEKTSELENGISILFLALGTLNWTDTEDDNKEYSSPILLIPCDLDRTSSRVKFVLSCDKLEEAETNITLQEMLLKTTGLNLPEYDPEKHETYEKYFDEINTTIENKPEWKIEENVIISTFAYSAISIWHDLEKIKKTGTSNETILSMLNDKISTDDSSNDTLEFTDEKDFEGGKIDDILEIKEQSTILDADYSQLLAIKKASGNKNLVIDGPPGTGKSQTICNIIADYLSQGKTVLFVSQKQAALDVVRQQLDQKKLGRFCLDLHTNTTLRDSKLSNLKSKIYSELDEAMTVNLSPQEISFDIDKLKDYKTQLNDYVRLLHKENILNPISKTIFELQSSYAAISSKIDTLNNNKNISTIPLNFNKKNIDTLDDQKYEKIITAAKIVSENTLEFQEHKTNIWNCLNIEKDSLQLADEIESEISITIDKLKQLLSNSQEISTLLKLPASENLEELIQLQSIYNHLSQSPDIPKNWKINIIDDLKQKAKSQEEIQQKRTNIISILNEYFGDNLWGFEKVDLNNIADRLILTPESRQILPELFDDQWNNTIHLNIKNNQIKLAEIKEKSSIILQMIDQLKNLFKDNDFKTWNKLEVGIEILQNTIAIHPLPKELIDNLNDLKSIKKYFKDNKLLCNEIKILEQEIFSNFDKEIVNEVNKPLLRRYRGYTNFFARNPVFNSDYRSAKKIFSIYKHNTHQKLNYELEFGFIKNILQLKESKDAWSKNEKELKSKLGILFDGLDTNWDEIDKILSTLENILKLSDKYNLKIENIFKNPEFITVYENIKPQKIPIFNELKNNIQENFKKEYYQKVFESNMEFSLFNEKLLTTLDLLEKISHPLEQLQISKNSKFKDIEDIRDKVLKIIEFKNIENNHKLNSDSLSKDFVENYNFFETDWLEIIKKIEWIEELLALDIKKQITDDHLNLKSNLTPDISLNNQFNKFSEALSSFIKEIEMPKRIISLEKLSELTTNSFIIENTPNFFDNKNELKKTSKQNYKINYKFQYELKFISQIDLKDLLTRCTEISEKKLSVKNWLSYVSEYKHFDKIINEQFKDNNSSSVTEIIHNTTNQSMLIPLIIEKEIVLQLLDKIYQIYPKMLDFDSTKHENLIEKFKELDQKFYNANVNKIFKAIAKKSPVDGPASQASARGLLQKQVLINKRKISIHKLLEKCGQVIQRYKPCFMMSPLAVSKFIPLKNDTNENQLEFDLVIFDEASQITPELAVASILHGKKLILAGDNKQLPPTIIFRRIFDDSDEIYDEDDTNLFEGLESILDVAEILSTQGQIFNKANLNIHYRSKHQDLIQFSNHNFYNNRLFTFPSTKTNPWYGLHSVYLPNGIFKNRINSIEAEKIVDLIFDHMRNRPNESLGVVALSKSQSDHIWELYVQRRLNERDIDINIEKSEKGHEPFFVKNLENVQGDERDRIIISIGYAKDENGNLRKHFAAINNLSGDRRLNVLFTRAKMRIDLVHSIQSDEIVSDRPSILTLKRYLEYVNDPKQLFRSSKQSNGINAPESSEYALEVQKALEKRGYVVSAEVPESGYWIDMAIHSSNGDGFDLGIEFDGKSYHSAPAARDRDYLRQQHLENLGWKIHRIWSTAWIRNPENELKKVDSAIKIARNSNNFNDQNTHLNKKQNEIQEDIVLIQSKIPDLNPAKELILKDYIKSKLPIDSWQTLQNELHENLEKFVIEISNIEGPVHKDVIITRIREGYSLKSLRGKPRERVEQAINSVVETKRIFSSNNFLYSESQQKNKWPRRPVDEDITHYSQFELEKIIQHFIKKEIAIPKDDLIKLVSNHLGWVRIANRISKCIEIRIKNLINNKTIIEKSGKLQIYS